MEWSVKALFILGHTILDGLFCTLQLLKDLVVVYLLCVVEFLGKVVLDAEDRTVWVPLEVSRLNLQKCVACILHFNTCHNSLHILNRGSLRDLLQTSLQLIYALGALQYFSLARTKFVTNWGNCVFCFSQQRFQLYLVLVKRLNFCVALGDLLLKVLQNLGVLDWVWRLVFV